MEERRRAGQSISGERTDRSIALSATSLSVSAPPRAFRTFPIVGRDIVNDPLVRQSQETGLPFVGPARWLCKPQ